MNGPARKPQEEFLGSDHRLRVVVLVRSGQDLPGLRAHVVPCTRRGPRQADRAALRDGQDLHRAEHALASVHGLGLERGREAPQGPEVCSPVRVRPRERHVLRGRDSVAADSATRRAKKAR